MKIDTAGNYTLRYTAEDECGNETVIDRTLVVAAPRTVLYTDGTFIINESPRDMATNEALHGVATNVYAPFDDNNDYVYMSYSERPWDSQSASVKRVEIGTRIQPPNIQHWFYNFSNCEQFSLDNLDTSQSSSFDGLFSGCSSLQTVDLTNFDTANGTDFNNMFYRCTSLTNLDLSNFDTHSATHMRLMFYECTSLQTLDLSGFNTSNVTVIDQMFANCRALTTIYAPTFDLDQITTLSNMTRMFADMSTNLVGGAGTTWSWSNPTDKTYARVDNPPDAPGYFTLKPTT